ncbi:MAG TPA: 2Fe-2S iron-sulfur cluster-binding protein [Gemmataceae bacterium]|nr:2Fe-2S iron-sulfur cluster-binding protein [Gemmataceae bacterium]
MTADATPLPAGCLTDPARPLTFTFEGRAVPALEGQSIAAALYAAGVRIFSRSFKYHRPRGLFCVSGDCPNCLMQVDGRPNVRTCTEPARQGQIVRGQNAWPGLQFDLLRVFDKLDAFLPVGFYYKRFHKPRWLWPVFERVVRHVAGLGRIDVHDVPDLETEVEHLHTEVCVVGGGPAGLAAAAEAASAGADVLLLDRQPRLGGHLLYDGSLSPEVEGFISALQGHPRARVLCDTSVFGLYEGNMLGCVTQARSASEEIMTPSLALRACVTQRFLKVRAKHVIVCTGGRQQPLMFNNNDLPGIFLARGVQRLGRLHGVRAGHRAVVLTLNDDGHRIAAQIAGLGMEIAAVVDTRPAASIAAGPGKPWPVWDVGFVSGAYGRGCLQGVNVRQLSQNREEVIDCDLLCIASPLVPANELLRQGGASFRQGCWQPNPAVSDLSAAGAAAGTPGLTEQILEGHLRGAEVAAALGYSSPGLDTWRSLWMTYSHRRDARLAECAAEVESWDHPEWLRKRVADNRPRKSFVCLCEDVTEKDVAGAVAEGFDHIETLKRYSTATMGPCQGKTCGHALTMTCMLVTGRSPETIGTTTARPPAVPVEMAVLAAERRHHPVRRTPMHHWHQTHGARWIDAGQWKRPESYGDPAAEVRTVRTAAGLIDVSTLGKIEVVGPDAAELLERVYINEWADLRAGRARYGVMCTEEGIVFDDGVGARLAAEHFYLTATTGNAEAVFQWLELWRTTWRLNAVVLNRTSAFAAMNLAGPRAREVLARLTALDLSAAAFPYLALREGDVAGVACRLLRIGFVGELGYEIHCPSAHGQHLWEAILAAGAELGLKPFGVEAQRILRLEKGHLIVGQDTDALSSPLGAGLGRMVKFGKPLFHGREALLRLQEMGSRTRLVGFHVPDGAAPRGDNNWARQLEGCQVVEQGRSLGRVTSARWSPTLERFLGLAWVPEHGAAVGGQFLIRCAGADLPAALAPVPFYDPEGERLRS